ncbi:hypothetical protein KW850_21690 [Bacillus sp. sid0103]|uniref:hypothetical protein n=1 Tax=Bacillus sp. sid0103 TaxID=2856337 RepID=UPI001C4497E7|nr:hypothetical protein [Bacillus sp. sid0103]MBV7507846.1 hypothetical protein [Bacillus sp. sid0103]
MNLRRLMSFIPLMKDKSHEPAATFVLHTERLMVDNKFSWKKATISQTTAK